MTLPKPIALLRDKGEIGRILRQLPMEVLREAETRDDSWTWLAKWVQNSPVERWCVGTMAMGNAECAVLKKAGFKRMDTGVYAADTKARQNATRYQGVREVRFYFHEHDPARIVMRVVMDARWPDRFLKTFKAAASQRKALLRLAAAGEFDGADRCTVKSLPIGLHNIQHPLCRRAIERLCEVRGNDDA